MSEHIDVTRALAELAGADTRAEQWRQASAACAHAFTILRIGIKRENPDDGASHWDVFYCSKCLKQVAVEVFK